LLYFLISPLVNRSDRLYLVFSGRIALGEVHIFVKRERMRRSERSELSGLKPKEMSGFEFSGDSMEAAELYLIFMQGGSPLHSQESKREDRPERGSLFALTVKSC
jgi:hypothetical protein